VNEIPKNKFSFRKTIPTIRWWHVEIPTYFTYTPFTHQTPFHSASCRQGRWIFKNCNAALHVHWVFRLILSFVFVLRFPSIFVVLQFKYESQTKKFWHSNLIWHSGNAKKNYLNKFLMSKVSDFPFLLQRVYRVCFVIRSWINTKCSAFQCREENVSEENKLHEDIMKAYIWVVFCCLFVCLFIYYLLSLYVVTRHVNGEWRYSAFGKSLHLYKIL
jgi:hypothetical protein